MPSQLPVPFRYVRFSTVAGYVCLFIAVHYPVNHSGLTEYVAVFFVGGIALADLLLTQKAEFTSFFIARRGLVTFAIIVISLILAAAAILRTDSPRELLKHKIELIQFVLQGALVGVMVRVLILAMFARLLRGTPIEMTRLLLLGALTVFIWLFPLGQTHRHYSAPYVLGFALGFTLHYVVRQREHERAQAARLGRNIVESLGDVSLKASEVDAVRYYAKQRWRGLTNLLDQHEMTPVLAIIKASMKRIQGQYHEARTIVEQELAKGGHTPTLHTYLYLHRALNLSDLNMPLKEVHDDLDEAMKCSSDCLLSLVTKGLRTAEEIPLNTNDPNDHRTDEALGYIWEALKINDRSRPELVARIVGRAVPVTWTFLLDSYAYVLLKAGHVRFQKLCLPNVSTRILISLRRIFIWVSGALRMC